MVPNSCAQLIEQYREVRILHLTRKHLADGLADTTWCVDVPLIAWDKKRGKKRPTLNVIPVGMADEHMTVKGQCFRFHKHLAEVMRARPAIHDDESAGPRPNLDARGVAAVSHGTRAWFGDRTSGPPETYLHDPLSFQTRYWGALPGGKREFSIENLSNEFRCRSSFSITPAL